MSHPYNFATYILRALLLFTLLLAITPAQSVIALNREYFPGRAHGGFSSFRTMATRLRRRVGLRPRFFVTDASALGKVCGGSLRSQM
ncbi:TPA: hypothetical protein ACNFRY_001630 [Pseudomonas aeruginosa]|nr:hypothetical protein [Pseudomonas aeruginosa]